VLILFCIVFGSLAAFFKPITVDGASMNNTLVEGDYLYSKRYILEEPKRFDIAIVSTDRSQGLNGRTIVKRIIGVPGDRVIIANGIVSVNGNRIQEPYALGEAKERVDIALGKDEYFVMGDNRPESIDSRRFGVLNRRSLISRVFIILYPKDRRTIIR
jgi:signal peptidase I